MAKVKKTFRKRGLWMKFFIKSEAEWKMFNDMLSSIWNNWETEEKCETTIYYVKINAEMNPVSLFRLCRWCSNIGIKFKPEIIWSEKNGD